MLCAAQAGEAALRLLSVNTSDSFKLPAAVGGSWNASVDGEKLVHRIVEVIRDIDIPDGIHRDTARNHKTTTSRGDKRRGRNAAIDRSPSEVEITEIAVDLPFGRA